MSEPNFKGTRCRICTGCGRCAGGGGLHVVMASGFGERKDAEPIPSPRGERLVTADIGTTTIALQLYDRDGRVRKDHAAVNPQVRFGADVLSRIRAAQDPENRERMRGDVRGELGKALESFHSFLEPGETLRTVLAGNATMIYLLMGWDPAPLGRAPFTAEHLGAMETELETRRGTAPCTIFPGLSAFVGGDVAAGMYACGMPEREDVTLLVDLGTNGELVLGNRRRRIACATAAGPAFEGGVNRGVWGADMVHLLARLRREGIVDGTGLLRDEFFDTGILIGGVRVTQEAIRAIQLAKGAIAAGIRILMKEYGLRDGRGIGRVILAGGFGYYLDPRDAAAIGLLPGDLADQAVAGGNTALSGALRLGRKLLARGEDGFDAACAEDETAWRAETEILNLAEHPDFEKYYIRSMDLEAWERS